MSNVKILRNSTNKPIDLFITDLTAEIEKRGFSIHHQDKSDMVEFYRNEGVKLPDNYKHKMIQICKAEASGVSLHTNPERSVFVQKFIFIYSKGETTEIRILAYSGQLIADLLGHNEFEKGPSDDDFGKRMDKTFATMQEMVEIAL